MWRWLTRGPRVALAILFCFVFFLVLAGLVCVSYLGWARDPRVAGKPTLATTAAFGYAVAAAGALLVVEGVELDWVLVQTSA